VYATVVLDYMSSIESGLKLQAVSL
jgi:hypothetical protein